MKYKIKHLNFNSIIVGTYISLQNFESAATAARDTHQVSDEDFSRIYC